MRELAVRCGGRARDDLIVGPAGVPTGIAASWSGAGVVMTHAHCPHRQLGSALRYGRLHAWHPHRGRDDVTAHVRSTRWRECSSSVCLRVAVARQRWAVDDRARQRPQATVRVGADHALQSRDDWSCFPVGPGGRDALDAIEACRESPPREHLLLRTPCDTGHASRARDGARRRRGISGHRQSRRRRRLSAACSCAAAFPVAAS
jgi:hypothetical protein